MFTQTNHTYFMLSFKSYFNWKIFDKNILSIIYTTLDINQNPTLQTQVTECAQESLGNSVI